MRCDFSNAQLYPVFDENGTPILPCGKDHCATKAGKQYTPTTTNCIVCGEKFQSACPGIIFCSQECFETTDTQAEWNETKEQRKRRFAKARKQKYLKTEKGKRTKKAQNQRYYTRRKARGIPQAAYAEKKAQRMAVVSEALISVAGQNHDTPPALTAP
jgi:hypothetical protein